MNTSGDSIQEHQTESNKNHRSGKGLDQTGFLSGIFLSSFEQVVNRGNSKPYTVEMLFKLPNEISLSHCEKIASEEVKTMIKQMPLSFFSCAKLIQGYIAKVIANLMVNELIHLFLPFILIELVTWIQEETPTTPEALAKSRMKGYFYILLSFVLSIGKIYCIAYYIKWVSQAEAFLKNVLNVKIKRSTTPQI